MKKILRLTESELISLIKKSLNEQNNQTWADKIKSKINQLTGAGRLKILEQIWCSVKFGKINAEVLTWKGKQWCGEGGFAETFKVTEEEKAQLMSKCDIFSTPELTTQKKEGWDNIYMYFRDKEDGSQTTSIVKQGYCEEWYYFEAKLPDGTPVTIYSDGTMWYGSKGLRSVAASWSWDSNTQKPVFDRPLTKKATGYAKTEEDITQNNKILNTGSSGNLVRRIQFEILRDSKGKINPGCKKDTDGNFKPRLCDGVFGPKTKDGVKNFQIENGLQDKSGIVGKETWLYMDTYPIDSEGSSEEQIKNS